jgi:ABC-2 type transport system ATP-binding protein
VGLAQTLIHNPEILVLDEPTEGLDPNQMREIRSLIREIGREKTVLLSTHILAEVEATCGRVIIIRDGTLVATGTPDELRRRSSGAGSYVLRVRGAQAGIESSLASLAAVERFTYRGEDGVGLHRYEVVGRTPDIGEDLFRWAVRDGLTLAELRREGATLEDVFRELTTEERPVHA